MKKILYYIVIPSLIILLSYLIFFSGKSNMAIKNTPVTNVTTTEAYKLLNENKNLIVLDVRTKEEFMQGHLKGAIQIPYNELSNRISEIEKYKDTPILVYCRSGNRSSQAINVLTKNEFNKIYHMYQGISAWSYDLEK